MIYIMEVNNKDKYFSGTSSLFIFFNEVEKDKLFSCINLIKSTETYHYHDDIEAWEILPNKLSYILDNFTLIDDIKLILMNKKTTQRTTNLVLNHKTKMRDYQEEGVRFGLDENNKKWLLLDSPGLGKTLLSTYLAEELKAQRGIKHCLIICGIASLRSNWKNEIHKHSSEQIRVLGQRQRKNGNYYYASVKERVEELLQPIDEFFVTINVESIRDDDIVEAIIKGPNRFDMIIFDEVHLCSGFHSQQSTNLLKLDAEYMLGMTGTLILNSALSAYLPLCWLGYEPKRSVGRFKDTYCVFDKGLYEKYNRKDKYSSKAKNIKGIIVGSKNLDILQDEIQSHSLRRTKDLLNLPSKNFIDEHLTMSDAQQKFYDTIVESVREENNLIAKEQAKEACDKIELNASNLLAMTTRLRQATSCPQVLTTSKITSCKVERCVELVNELVSNKEKVVIMSTFKEPVYQLKELLKDYKPLLGTGEIADKEVEDNIKMFQEDDEHYVFIGTSQKMGTGFTLNRASYMILIDFPYTYALYLQLCDRIHRFGTTRPVFIYNLICENTIDEAVLNIINKKKALSEYIIDDTVSDESRAILYKNVKDFDEIEEMKNYISRLL